MGDRLDAGRRLPQFLLQHHPDRRGRHARAGPAHRPAPRPARLRRAQGRQARRHHHRRRRPGRSARRCSRCSSASPNSSARPRTGCPRPRRRASSTRRCATPSTTGSTASPNQASKLLDWRVERAEERLRRKKEKEIDRQIGDAQAPPARQARRLHAVGGAGRRDLHRRGRLAPAAAPSRRATAPARRSCRCAARCSTSPAPPATSSPANQQIADLIQALGCGTRDRYREDDLRYDKIILMTDADVDGAHIASLLITFFFQEMPELIDEGHLYLAHAAALPHQPGRQDRSTPWTTPHKDALLAHRVQGQEARHHPLQGPRRDAATSTCARPPWTRDPHAAAGARWSRTATGPRSSVERLMGNQARGALRLHPGKRRVRHRPRHLTRRHSHIKQTLGKPVDSKGLSSMFRPVGTTLPLGGFCGLNAGSSQSSRVDEHICQTTFPGSASAPR